MPADKADLILLNGDIRTQDPALPNAESVAIGSGRIVAFGAGAELKHMAGNGATVIDLCKRLVLPGFIDSHFHFYDWALARAGLQLDRVDSLTDMLEMVKKTAAAGLAVSIHAVGDRANSEIISLFERQALKLATAVTPPQGPALAHRIEHLQMIRPRDLQRLGRLALTACVQPPNLPLDMKMIDAAVGDGGRRAYAFRHILDSGIPTCFSSDAPVCDPNPLLGIHAAVTRQLPGSRTCKGWYPEQCLTVDEAVAGYTATPAQASGCWHALGSISVGKMADLVVLDQNIFTIPHRRIAEARVMLTVFNGEIVFRDGL